MQEMESSKKYFSYMSSSVTFFSIQLQLRANFEIFAILGGCNHSDLLMES